MEYHEMLRYIPEKLIRMVQLFYKDTQCKVIDAGEE